MPYHVMNLSEQGQWRWPAFSERKVVYLLKFWMYSLLIRALHVYQGRQLPCSLCFQRAGSERRRFHDWESRTLALTRRVQTAGHEDGRRTDRSLSMELNLSVATVHAIVWGLRQHMMFPLGPTSNDIHTCEGHHKSLSPKHLQLYSTVADAFVRWTVEGNDTWCHHSEPTEKNHQACNGDTALHHDRRNPSHKHPPSKLC